MKVLVLTSEFLPKSHLRVRKSPIYHHKRWEIKTVFFYSPSSVDSKIKPQSAGPSSSALSLSLDEDLNFVLHCASKSSCIYIIVRIRVPKPSSAPRHLKILDYKATPTPGLLPFSQKAFNFLIYCVLLYCLLAIWFWISKSTVKLLDDLDLFSSFRTKLLLQNTPRRAPLSLSLPLKSEFQSFVIIFFRFD